MSASLDQPAPYYSDPGGDQRLPSLSEAVDTVLMIIGADRNVTPDEVREVQRLNAGMIQIAQIKNAQMQAGSPEQPTFSGDTPQDFGTQAGVEPAGGSGPAPGAQYLQG